MNDELSYNLNCYWTYSDHLKTLRERFDQMKHDSSVITLQLANIHSWWEKQRSHKPAICELPTNLTMIESEESRVRFNYLFEPSFKWFDGSSTTHPSSSVQRVYVDSYMDDLNVSMPLNNFTSLVKGK